MTLNKTQNQIFAILFACGEPMEADRIAQVLEQDPVTTERLLGSLGDWLDETESPLQLQRLEGRYQLSTRPDYAPVIKAALEVRRNVPLSQAALEVLAVVAYNQPVTRSFVDQVRGVDSSGVVSSLVEKGLIEEAGRLDLPGRPISYRTTAHFLRTFGFSSLSQLPPIESEGASEESDAAGEELDPDDQPLEGQVGFYDEEPEA
mgnify:CR=1 FL=1